MKMLLMAAGILASLAGALASHLTTTEDIETAARHLKLGSLATRSSSSVEPTCCGHTSTVWTIVTPTTCSATTPPIAPWSSFSHSVSSSSQVPWSPSSSRQCTGPCTRSTKIWRSSTSKAQPPSSMTLPPPSSAENHSTSTSSSSSKDSSITFHPKWPFTFGPWDMPRPWQQSTKTTFTTTTIWITASTYSESWFSEITTAPTSMYAKSWGPPIKGPPMQAHAGSGNASSTSASHMALATSLATSPVIHHISYYEPLLPLSTITSHESRSAKANLASYPLPSPTLDDATSSCEAQFENGVNKFGISWALMLLGITALAMSTL